MMLKWLSSSVERCLKNFFSWGWVAAFDIRRYISRPSASNARAFLIPSAASPDMSFSFRIRPCSRRNIRILASWGAEGTLGNFPFSSSFAAIAWMSSMCFVSSCANRANTCLAKGSALLDAAAVKNLFPSFSNRNARISELAGLFFPFARPAFGISYLPVTETGLAYYYASRTAVFPALFAGRRREFLSRFVLRPENYGLLSGRCPGVFPLSVPKGAAGGSPRGDTPGFLVERKRSVPPKGYGFHRAEWQRAGARSRAWRRGSRPRAPGTGWHARMDTLPYL